MCCCLPPDRHESSHSVVFNSHSDLALSSVNAPFMRSLFLGNLFLTLSLGTQTTCTRNSFLVCLAFSLRIFLSAAILQLAAAFPGLFFHWRLSWQPSFLSSISSPPPYSQFPQSVRDCCTVSFLPTRRRFSRSLSLAPLSNGLIPAPFCSLLPVPPVLHFLTLTLSSSLLNATLTR